MSYEIQGEEDLGIADCDFVAHGETPADVVEQVVEHLQDEHDIDMPDLDAILENEVEAALLPESVRLVVARLQEALNISDAGTPDVEPPLPPTASTRPRM